jgi:hypothetical protein
MESTVFTEGACLLDSGGGTSSVNTVLSVLSPC